jgi:hypothetical protein
MYYKPENTTKMLFLQVDLVNLNFKMKICSKLSELIYWRIAFQFN